MVLLLNRSLQTVLGSTFSVSHDGPSGTVSVTVNVGVTGRDDEKPLPAVFIERQFGDGSPSDIGGGASEGTTMVDLHVITIDSHEWDGNTLLDDIHKEVESRIRQNEKSLGNAFFAWTSTFRDQGPTKHEGGLNSYTRVLTIQAYQLESY